MPPYPIDPTAESVRDTARLGLNIPPSQTAMGIAVTSASGDASTAAPNEAASENSGAGPPGTPLQSLLRLLAGGWRAFQDCRRRERLRASLCGLSERELKDIGLTPGDIDHIVAFRAFETRRNDAMNPWPCRSVM
ncbi:DUF1127 domain-containing protein [Bradyrhizobium sp. BTAi1]|uniref:DUF1127 domain-containing protein n=1 Tax=Bradyrhizobium sp. (strain BTAi1 / ATCC BAA-1182) TaxID=288000 RepID=UPI00005DE000|nr:DUF1127 domain-containing protein [Bradyrhizobium sp. BTAi1]ABQ36769.1 hypothetical protein BBta_4743 [Bradyrhizobium sp. BTAi1]